MKLLIGNEPQDVERIARLELRRSGKVCGGIDLVTFWDEQGRYSVLFTFHPNGRIESVPSRGLLRERDYRGYPTVDEHEE